MALITLSPGQFAKTPVGRKPGSSYKNYLAYVQRRRQAKQPALPVGSARINNLLTQYLGAGFQDPATQRRQAIQSVNDAIATSLGDIRSTTKAEQEQANRQAAAYEGFAKALGGMREGDAERIAGLYRDAGADQARFAAGVTGAVGAAAQGDAAGQQADIAAATGGMGGYRGTDVPALQGVGSFLGGYLPSARLAENAAYAGVDVLNQGYAGAQRLGLESAGMRQKAIDLQKQLAEERIKLAKQRPSLVRQALQDVQSGQRSDLATLANVLYLQNTQAKTTADLTGTYGGVPTVNTYTDAQGRTRQYDPGRYQVVTRKNGTQYLKPLPVAAGSRTPRNKAGLTPSQVATADRARERAITGARGDMVKVLQNQKGALWTQPNALYAGLPGYAPKRKSYTEAKQYLMTNFANDLIRQYPQQAALVRQMVEEALSSAGFKPGAAPAKKTTPTVPRATGSPFGSPFFSNPLAPPRKKGR